MIKTQYLSNLLFAHQYQGGSNNCAPYSISIILNALGITNILGNQLADEMNRLRWKGFFPIIYRFSNWATFPWGVVNTFHKYGVYSKWNLFASISCLKSCLLSNIIPIVVTGGFFPLWAHVRIVVAYDGIKGWGFIDPANQKKVINWQQQPLFISQWTCMGRILIKIFPS